MGNFKVAIYLPSQGQVFVSNSIKRSYEGYYGRDTTQVYQVQLTKSGEASIIEDSGSYNDDLADSSIDSNIEGPSKDYVYPLGSHGFGAVVLVSFLVTLFLEQIAALIFTLIKKFPKIILLAVVIGNIVSVPLLWIIVSRFYRILYPMEILAVVFEAWLLKLFGRGKISWKWCLIVSLAMNLASFIFGPIILSY